MKISNIENVSSQMNFTKNIFFSLSAFSFSFVSRINCACFSFSSIFRFLSSVIGSAFFRISSELNDFVNVPTYFVTGGRVAELVRICLPTSDDTLGLTGIGGLTNFCKTDQNYRNVSIINQ